MDRVIKGKSRQFSPFFLSGKDQLSPIYKRSLRKRAPHFSPPLTRSVEYLRKSVPLIDPKPALGIGFGALADIHLSQRDLKPLTSRSITKRKSNISPGKKGIQVVNLPGPATPLPDAPTVKSKLTSISLSRSFLKLPGTYKRYYPGRYCRKHGDNAILRSSPEPCTTDRAPSTSLFHNLSIRAKCQE